jgi:hypothetical protein
VINTWGVTVLVLHVRIWGYMYMEVLRILLSAFIVCHISGNCWAAMKNFLQVR